MKTGQKFHHIYAESAFNVTHKVPTFYQVAKPVLGHNWFMHQFSHRKGLQEVHNAQNNYENFQSFCITREVQNV
jgi:hypothetical protein